MLMDKLFSSTTAGSVLGIAQTRVMPPARAALVPEAKSSLWIWPGSRRCTWVSTSPGSRTVRADDMQSMWVLTLGAFLCTAYRAETSSLAHLTSVMSGTP